jgi:hypothetical protein
MFPAPTISRRIVLAAVLLVSLTIAAAPASTRAACHAEGPL